jgi:hypothetical protein
MKRGRSKAGQPTVDSNSTAGIQALVGALGKKRWRAPQWVRDLAMVKGMPLRKRGRPRKKA